MENRDFRYNTIVLVWLGIAVVAMVLGDKAFGSMALIISNVWLAAKWS